MKCNRILGIAACDPNGVIGKNGQLPWHCPEEMHHFSETVSGSTLIVGQRTFLTLSPRYYKEQLVIVFAYNKPTHFHQNILFVSSLEDFFSLELILNDLYIIGGGEIYRLFLEVGLIEEFVLTTMKHIYEGDTFFPLTLLKGWKVETIRETSLFRIERYNNENY